MDGFLTLRDALDSNRLDDFIAQAEADGVAAANRELFDDVVRRVTALLPEGQTSRSRARGSSRGK
jgi:putative lipoic acid-binding regulatory protein